MPSEHASGEVCRAVTAGSEDGGDRPDHVPPDQTSPDAGGRVPDGARDGKAFGPYRLLSLIGRGGMGEVWRAYDTRRERTVALKRLSVVWADDPEVVSRFRREARATAQLSSAHVIPIHDFGEIDGRLFVDMRLVEGRDLSGELAVHPEGLPPAQAVEVVGQIAGALSSAHAVGLVHRDVKPSNVVLAADPGRGYFCYLVDFGIAKAVESAGSANLTRSGAVLGTPAYMAPELFSGAGTAGVASDVYALGCVLHEALTGARPFPGSDMPTLMHHHLTSPPRRPSAHRAGLAPFDDIVVRALAKNPADRPASAAEVAAACRSVMSRDTATVPRSEHPPPAPRTGRPPAPSTVGPAARTVPTGAPARPPGSPRPLRPPPRSPWLWVGVAAAVLLLGAVVAGGVVLSTRASTPGSSPTGAPPPLSLRDGGLPQAGSGLALSPDGRRLYTAAPGNDSEPGTQLVVSDVDPATGSVTPSAAVPVGSIPAGVAVSPDGRRVYVANRGSDASPQNTVSVVDTGTLAVVATVAVGLEPSDLAVSPDGGRVYVSDTGPNDTGSTVSVIDTATSAVVATVPVDTGPARLVASPDGRSVYVSAVGPGTTAGSTVTVVDTASNTPRSSLTTDPAPLGLAVSPDGSTLFVGAVGLVGQPRGSVQALDPRSGTNRRPATDAAATTALASPFAIAISPDGAHVLVGNSVDNAPGGSLLVLDSQTGALQGQEPLATKPYAIVVAPDLRHAYVSTGGGLQIVDLAT